MSGWDIYTEAVAEHIDAGGEGILWYGPYGNDAEAKARAKARAAEMNLYDEQHGNTAVVEFRVGYWWIFLVSGAEKEGA